jgi:hypothetical protein
LGLFLKRKSPSKRKPMLVEKVISIHKQAKGKCYQRIVNGRLIKEFVRTRPPQEGYVRVEAVLNTRYGMVTKHIEIPEDIARQKLVC